MIPQGVKEEKKALLTTNLSNIYIYFTHIYIYIIYIYIKNILNIYKQIYIYIKLNIYIYIKLKIRGMDKSQDKRSLKV